MEIIEHVSQIIIAAVSIGVLGLAVMVFSFLIGKLMTTLFE